MFSIISEGFRMFLKIVLIVGNEYVQFHIQITPYRTIMLELVYNNLHLITLCTMY